MDDIQGEDTPQGGAAAPDLFESAWRYRRLIAVATVLAGLAGFAVLSLQPAVYEAEARLVLNDPATAGVFGEVFQGSNSGSRHVNNVAEAASSPQVMVRAAELLDGQLDEDEIAERVEARPAGESDVLVIAARDSTRQGAALLANTVADAYEELAAADVEASAERALDELADSQTEVQSTLDWIEAALAEDPGNPRLQAQQFSALSQLDRIDRRANEIKVDASLYGSGIRSVQEAQPPEESSNGQPIFGAIIAAVLGLLGVTAFAWWRADRTRSVDRRQDAAPLLRAPLLGQVPDFKAAGVTGADPTRSAPYSQAAEAYQFVVASLEHTLQRTGCTSLAVTSAADGDGKSVTALNLAIAAAREGRRVVLVDADERGSGLTRLVGVTAAPGLTDLADDAVPFADCSRRLPALDEDLSFVPAGSRPPTPARFFRTPAFRRVMARLNDHADLVIIDTPSLLTVSDTSAIADQADGILFVVARGTSVGVLEAVRERLGFVGTPVLGYVFNRVSPRQAPGGADRNGAGQGQALGAETAAVPSPNGDAHAQPAPSSSATGAETDPSVPRG